MESGKWKLVGQSTYVLVRVGSGLRW